MKLPKIVRLAVSFPACIILLATPLSAVAASGTAIPASPQAASPTELAPFIITEIQTGGAKAADEFTELYNATDEPLDITNRQLRFVSASAEKNGAAPAKPTATITLTPPLLDGQPAQVPAHGYYVLHTGSVAAADGTLGQVYASTGDLNLVSTGGTLLLLDAPRDDCQRTVQDAVAWGSGNFGEGGKLANVSKDKIFARYIDNDGWYVDSGNNAHDFALLEAKPQNGNSLATIGADNQQRVAGEASNEGANDGQSGVSGLQASVPVLVMDQECLAALPPASAPGTVDPSTDSPPDTIDPAPADEQESPGQSEEPISEPSAANMGLAPPQISELLPNPAPPGTDEADEFIELYNPNNAPYDLSGYELETGLATKHHYTFPDGTVLPAQAFVAFYSADTNLSLTNTGSQAHLFDPQGNVVAQTDAYGVAKDGQAWILANGSWQWTATPSPNAVNVAKTPVVAITAKKTTTAKTTAKKTSAVKSASTAKPKAKSSAKPAAKNGQDTAQSVAAKASGPSLHPGVLAAVAGFALLYGLYEYRRDLANKFRSFRDHRSARRTARQNPEGR